MTREERIWAVAQHCGTVKDCVECPCYEEKKRAGFCNLSDPAVYEKIFGEEVHRTGETEGKPAIKDSGSRREFETGAVRDVHEGKGRMDLLPWAAIMEVSKHCENGSRKYGEHNVDKGIPTSSLCDSAARHLAKHLDGQTDEPHLLAATWNLLWAVQMTIKNPEMVNTPWKREGEKE